jgi:hypothetical protein
MLAVRIMIEEDGVSVVNSRSLLDGWLRNEESNTLAPGIATLWHELCRYLYISLV